MLITLFLILGFLSLALGILGIFLPGLPTTPFVILASYSFIKSSPRLHKWLLDSRLGDYIRKYEQNPGLHRKTKIYIIFLMTIICSISIIFFIQSVMLRILVGVAGLIGVISVIFFIPTIKGKIIQ